MYVGAPSLTHAVYNPYLWVLCTLPGTFSIIWCTKIFFKVAVCDYTSLAGLELAVALLCERSGYRFIPSGQTLHLVYFK